MHCFPRGAVLDEPDEEVSSSGDAALLTPCQERRKTGLDGGRRREKQLHERVAFVVESAPAG